MSPGFCCFWPFGEARARSLPWFMRGFWGFWVGVLGVLGGVREELRGLGGSGSLGCRICGVFLLDLAFSAPCFPRRAPSSPKNALHGELYALGPMLLIACC